uniref:UPAR/Ly6 domain-containing protein n=1 Tax=Xenopus tropicalis TaxID=8364 RepID=A0A6I8R478_XENTR
LEGTGHIFSAVPLQCYTCASATSNTDCRTLTKCHSTDSYCQTVVSTVSGKSVITKSCAPSCTPGINSTAGVTDTVSCCSSNLCNMNWPSGSIGQAEYGTHRQHRAGRVWHTQAA